MVIEVAGGNPQPSYQKCCQFQGEKNINPGNLPALSLQPNTVCDFLYGVHQNMAHSVPPPQHSAMSLEPKKVPLPVECACKPSKLWGWVRVRLLLERGALEGLRLPVLGVICGWLIDVAAPTRSSKRYSRWGNCFHYRKCEGVGREQ